MTEICGDEPLSGKDRRRYLLRGLAGVVQHVLHSRPVQAFRLQVADPDLAAKIAEGAAPFRVYTSALIQRALGQVTEEPRLICDVGCGSGGQRRFFSGLARPDAYLGLDSEYQIEWRAARNEDGCTFIQAVAEAIPVGDRSTDITFSSSALEHVRDMPGTASELARISVPGGLGIHVVPAPFSLFLYMFHGYRRFSPAQLQQHFASAGFEIVSIWSLGGLPSFLLHGFWITWLESGAIFEWAAVGRLPGGLRRLLAPAGPRMRTGCGLALYSSLLRRALALDCFFPHPAIGYGVVVRKS